MFIAHVYSSIFYKNMLLSIVVQTLDLLDRLLLLWHCHALMIPVTKKGQTVRTIALTLALCQLEGQSL